MTDPASTSPRHGRTVSPLPPPIVHHSPLHPRRPCRRRCRHRRPPHSQRLPSRDHHTHPPAVTSCSLPNYLGHPSFYSCRCPFHVFLPLPHISRQTSSVKSLRLVLGNARCVMYAISSHVYNGNNIPPYNIHHTKGGHQLAQHSPNPPLPPPSQRSASSISKEPIVVVGIPSVSIQSNRLVVGSAQTSQFISPGLSWNLSLPSLGSTRSYTPLKVLGDGSFGTVWLCDWHGTLPPNTPLSPMQCGAGARPEWAGKRLVAVKRMKKEWRGGWDECQKLKELEVSAMFSHIFCHSSVSSISHYVPSPFIPT